MVAVRATALLLWLSPVVLSGLAVRCDDDDPANSGAAASAPLADDLEGAKRTLRALDAGSDAGGRRSLVQRIEKETAEAALIAQQEDGNPLQEAKQELSELKSGGLNRELNSLEKSSSAPAAQQDLAAEPNHAAPATATSETENPFSNAMTQVSNLFFAPERMQTWHSLQGRVSAYRAARPLSCATIFVSILMLFFLCGGVTIGRLWLSKHESWEAKQAAEKQSA
eukprot:TRINITY_DN103054_c0_g1_i1.p1 TRINITY_DN103054_c0_g1~~TRINITY_DN103054_c0_g1_i1.p1  ORF type:complete len:225 (-),score=67.97 TRINITY_DN103054_c0_g1_i1:96-770(-)